LYAQPKADPRDSKVSEPELAASEPGSEVTVPVVCPFASRPLAAVPQQRNPPPEETIQENPEPDAILDTDDPKAVPGDVRLVVPPLHS
jgi:hypothetical protein